MMERTFQKQVEQIARHYHWRTFHAPDNRPIQTKTGVRRQAVTPGYPDLTMVRAGELVFAELKVGKNRVTERQAEWLTDLALVPGVETYVWTPDQWDEINDRLARGRHRIGRAA